MIRAGNAPRPSVLPIKAPVRCFDPLVVIYSHERAMLYELSVALWRPLYGVLCFQCVSIFPGLKNAPAASYGPYTRFSSLPALDLNKS